jgi:hypothetical protein
MTMNRPWIGRPGGVKRRIRFCRRLLFRHNLFIERLELETAPLQGALALLPAVAVL